MATGHGVAVAFGTSGTPSNVISVTPPPVQGQAVPRPGMSTPQGGADPQLPGDTYAPGVMTIVVEYEESYDPPLYVTQDVVVTYRIPQGLTNAAVDTYAGAFVVGYAVGDWLSNTRREATLTVQTQGKPAKTAAS